MADRALSQPSIPPDPATELQWISTKLKYEIWDPRQSLDQQALAEGMRSRRRRLAYRELERLRTAIPLCGLRVEIISPDGPQVKLFLPGPDGEEVLRISWWHIPTSMDDARYRRRLAWTIFRRMAGLERDEE